MSYHYETLIELYKLFNRFEKIEIENANKEKTLNYIKFNGLESYKSDNYMKNFNESFKRN